MVSTYFENFSFSEYSSAFSGRFIYFHILVRTYQNIIDVFRSFYGTDLYYIKRKTPIIRILLQRLGLSLTYFFLCFIQCLFHVISIRLYRVQRVFSTTNYYSLGSLMPFNAQIRIACSLRNRNNTDNTSFMSNSRTCIFSQKIAIRAPRILHAVQSGGFNEGVESYRGSGPPRHRYFQIIEFYSYLRLYLVNMYRTLENGPND